MATGDQEDIVNRLRLALPKTWFPSNADEQTNPVLAAVLAMPGSVGSWLYGLIAFTKAQTRLATATGVFLDLIAWDFFRDGLVRRPGQTDEPFRSRIKAEILRKRTTRPALRGLLIELTNREPTMFEPTRPSDTGSYGTSIRTPASGLSGLSVDATWFTPDMNLGGIKGQNMVRVGDQFLDTGAKVILYRASQFPQAFISHRKEYKADARYRVTVRVKKIQGAGKVGDVISASYHDGTRVTRASAPAINVTGNELASVSVEFVNKVAGIYDIYALGGITDATWAIHDFSVTEVIDPAGYPKITTNGKGGYGVAGKYGSLNLKNQGFIDVYRSQTSGIPRVAGYSTPAGGYRVGRSQWSDIFSTRSGISDDEIIRAINANKAVGVTVWVKIHS